MTYDSWRTVIWLLAAVDLGLALLLTRWLLHRLAVKRSEGASSRMRSRSLMTVVALFMVLKAWIFLELVPSQFGLVRMVYLDLVVVLPCVGLALLWWLRGTDRSVTRTGRLRSLYAISVICVLLAPVGVYASYVEPAALQIERATVSLDKSRTGRRPVRIAVLADIQTEHVTSYEFGVINRAMALHPDIILIPGDLHQDTARNFASELPKLKALLARLRAPGGVFIVQGDTDHVDRLRQIVAGSHVTLLYNEITQATVHDRLVAVGGLQLNHRSPRARRMIKALESRRRTDDIRILLTHPPDPVLRLRPNTRIDLTIAGHTHGGQINPPLIDPPITLSDVPRWVAAGGLHDVGKQRRVYVSRGIGVERGLAPRIRFGAPPEISVITLRG